MKNKKILILFMLALTGILLSSCSGAVSDMNWPGITATDSTLYVANASEVIAIKTSDNSLLWRWPSKVDARKVYYAPPAFIDGQLIVGDYQNTITSLDPNSGNEKWSFGSAKGGFVASPTIVNNTILIPSTDYKLYALDLQGNQLWTFAAGQMLWATPVSDGKTVFQAAMDRSIYAIDLVSGKQKWKTDLNGAAISTPFLSDDGKLFLGDLANEFLCLDANTGQIIWTYTTKGAVWAKPVINSGVVYFGDFSGGIYALDSQLGSVKWSIEAGSPIIASPAVLPDKLVFLKENGEVQAVSFDGQNIWSHTIQGKLYSTPAVVNEKIIIPVTSGESLLVVLDFNGNSVGSFVTPKR
jgi:eukaryotic-like serine/threonine-protein kinase